MNCKRCGFPLSGNDQFCKNCGAVVNEMSASNTNTNVNVGSFDNNMPKKEGLSVNNGMSSQSINSGMNNGINSQPVNNGMNNPSMNRQPNYQQPINQQPRYQQPMGQPMNQIYQQPIMNQTPPKSKSNTKLIIGIIAAVLVVAIIVGVILIVKNSNNSGNNGGGNGSLVSSNKSYKVTYKGFTFNIPNNLICEERSGRLLIGNEADTWVAQIELGKGNFAQLKSRKSKMQELFQKNGYTSSMAVEKNLGGTEFITLELSNSGNNVIAAYAKADSMNFMAIVALNVNNEFDYSILEKIAPIISQVTYTGDTNNIETDLKIDISSIAELAK